MESIASEQIAIARQAAELSAADLLEVCRTRGLDPLALNSWLDFAQQASQGRAVASAISVCSRAELDQLAGNARPSTSVTEALERALLVSRQTGSAFASVKGALSQAPLPDVHEPASASTSDSGNTGEVRRLTRAAEEFGLICVSATARIRFLISWIERERPRRIGQAIGQGLQRELAGVMGVEHKTVGQLIPFLESLGLILAAQGSWQPTSQGEALLGERDATGFAKLAAVAWLGLPNWLRTAYRDYLAKIRGAEGHGQLLDLQGFVDSRFPLLARLNQVEAVSLLHEQFALANLEPILSRFDLEMAQVGANSADALEQSLVAAIEEAVEASWPAQARVILQSDGTVLQLGWLPEAQAKRLSEWAEVKKVGVTVEYRLGWRGIHGALERGEAPAEIAAFLSAISGAALPQPIDYLIKEAARKFDSILLFEGLGEERSRLEFRDANLLELVLHDVRFRGLGLSRRGGKTLVSAASAGRVHELLLDGGIPVIWHHKEVSVGRHLSGSSSWGQALAALRAIEQLKSESAGTEVGDLVERLNFAIRHRSEIGLSADIGGNHTEFRLLPLALKNGRLRAKDQVADVERTLPLSAIRLVQL